MTLVGRLAAHPNQGPIAVQFLALEGEFERALAVPEEHGSAAVFALGNDPLELPVIERMVLDMDGQPLLPRIEARSLRHRPALQDAVELEAKIIVQPPRRMLLDDKGEPGAGFLMRRRGARRLRRLAEIPFASVFLERHAAQPCSEADQTHIVRPKRASKRGAS